MIDTRHAEELLGAFQPADAVTHAAAARIRSLLGTTAAPFSRQQFDPGHVTASALVLSPDGGSVALVHHRRLGLWLQPGGHIEPGDASLPAAARREATEETGLRLSDAGAPLIGLDVHEIPAARGEPAHLHHDMVFLFRAESTGLVISAESHAVSWYPIDQLSAVSDGAVVRYSRRATESLGERGAGSRR